MISGSQHGGRRRSLDAEVNLVPFIDLLSMCICFLLMTAVWIQIGTMQVKQSHGTDAPEADKKSLDLEVKFKSPTVIEGTFKRGAKVAHTFTSEGADAPKAIEAFKTSLGTALEKVGLNTAVILSAAKLGGTARADAVKQVSDTVATGMITPADGVNYGEMVGVMDALKTYLISNLGIVPVRKKGQ